MRSRSRPQVQTNVFPSGLEKAPEPLAYLFVGEKIALFQSRFASFHSVNEAVLFLEVAGHNILHNLIRIEAILGRSPYKAGLHVGAEMNFHAQKIRQNDSSDNGAITLCFRPT